MRGEEYRASFVRRFLRDDAGQDIVEYALLGALIGIASILAWQQIAASVGAVYGQSNVAVEAIACNPDPIALGGGGCPS